MRHSILLSSDKNNNFIFSFSTTNCSFSSHTSFSKTSVSIFLEIKALKFYVIKNLVSYKNDGEYKKNMILQDIILPRKLYHFHLFLVLQKLFILNFPFTIHSFFLIYFFLSSFPPSILN